MKLNREYLKEMILCIEAIPVARPRLSMLLEAMGMEGLNDEFLLHYEVLRDYGFIEGVPDKDEIGIINTDDEILWSDADIRLTSAGHEFATAIQQPEVWELLKKNFKDASIETIFGIAKDLAKNFAKKKLESLL